MSTIIMEESEIIERLESIQNDPNLITEPLYRADSAKWPDNKIPFITHHAEYLKSHPKVNPHHYLSNLRIMLKKRA